MVSTVIGATLSDGGRLELTIEEVGADGATLVVKAWGKSAAPGSKPNKTDLVELYKVKRLKKQDVLTCLAKAPGPDPVVTCTLSAGTGVQDRSLRLVVKGSFGGWADRDQTLKISEAQYQDGLAFLKAADFPVQ